MVRMMTDEIIEKYVYGCASFKAPSWPGMKVKGWCCRALARW